MSCIYRRVIYDRSSEYLDRVAIDDALRVRVHELRAAALLRQHCAVIHRLVIVDPELSSMRPIWNHKQYVKEWRSKSQAICRNEMSKSQAICRTP